MRSYISRIPRVAKAVHINFSAAALRATSASPSFAAVLRQVIRYDLMAKISPRDRESVIERSGATRCHFRRSPFFTELRIAVTRRVTDTENCASTRLARSEESVRKKLSRPGGGGGGGFLRAHVFPETADDGSCGGEATALSIVRVAHPRISVVRADDVRE